MTGDTTVHTIEKSLANIEAELQQHRQLICAALRGNERSGMSACATGQCRHRKLLQTTLLDVICALEETRHAFKSKQLERLRKSLIQVLAQDLDNEREPQTHMTAAQ